MPDTIYRPDIGAAIDEYIAAEQMVLGFFASARPTEEYLAVSNAFRRSLARLARLLGGQTEAYVRAGYRWQVDRFGELYKVEDDSSIKHLQNLAKRNFTKPRDFVYKPRSEA